jgi:hypothetical protein
MKRSILLSVAGALMVVSCSLSAVTPSPGIPVTGNTLPPIIPTVNPTSGSALTFDGRDDYMMVADDPSLDLPNSFTIAAWIYLEGYREWASLVTKGDKPNINNYAIQQSGPFDPIYKTEYGKMRFSGCAELSAPLPESETLLFLREWYFLAVTFDSLEMRFYLNGKPDGASNVQGPLCTNDRPLYIGVDFPLTTEYWYGAIDELKIWNTALSESQVDEVMTGITPLEASLVGYWTFDEGTGSIAHDRSVYANHGTLVGDPAWIQPGAPVQ